MQGTRLPDATLGEAGPGWEAWANGNAVIGAYMKVFNGSDKPYWYIRDPKGDIGTIGTHTVTEHEDGTITVSPSIAPGPRNPGGWHGFLERGVWRSV